MTQDVLEIRGLAREFAAAELRPHTEHWDAAGALGDDVVAKLAELGFFGMLVPESAGGMGFDLAACLAAIEELSWGEPAAALLVAENLSAADLIVRFGSTNLREQWLGRIAAGDALAALALAPEQGELRARHNEHGWIITGRTQYVLAGDRAELVIVTANDDDGAALFALPRTAGWRAGERAATLGLRPLSFVELMCDDVQVDADARLDHLRVLPEHPVAELGVAAAAVGIAQAALDHALAYAAQREQFGRPIRDFEGMQIRLSDMAVQLLAARALLEQAAAAPHDQLRVAAAKLSAGEAAMRTTTDAVQIFGGYGYMRDYPVEKLMRDAKAMAILHGPSEVQRRRIAAALYAE